MSRDIESQREYSVSSRVLTVGGILTCIIGPFIGLFVFVDIAEYVSNNPESDDLPDELTGMFIIYFTVQALLCSFYICGCFVKGVEICFSTEERGSVQRVRRDAERDPIRARRSSRSPSPRINQEYQNKINRDRIIQANQNKIPVDKDDMLCISCWENVRSVKLNCGHTGLCHTCAHKIKHKLRVCPVCRAEIINIREEIFSDRDYSPPSSNKSDECPT